MLAGTSVWDTEVSDKAVMSDEVESICALKRGLGHEGGIFLSLPFSFGKSVTTLLAWEEIFAEEDGDPRKSP
jgi:hypothetical protein